MSPHPDPLARVRVILATYLRAGVEARGHRWSERNERHMDELADLLGQLASPAAPEFGADLDEPTPAPPRRDVTFIGTREEWARSDPRPEDEDPQFAAWRRRRTAEEAEQTRDVLRRADRP